MNRIEEFEYLELCYPWEDDLNEAIEWLENAKELVYQWDDKNNMSEDFDRLLEKVKTLKLCFMDREMWRNNE